jgi:hypothetical protein
MALVARRVLADCEIAHQLLRKESTESATWRPHWVLCLTLLRAVGHVLDNVDGEADANHRAAISAKWEEWKADVEENRIFWDFIKAERNNLLKEYKFGVEAEPTYLALEEGGRLLTEEGTPLRIEEDFFRLSHVGFEIGKGETCLMKLSSGGVSSWMRLKHNYDSGVGPTGRPTRIAPRIVPPSPPAEKATARQDQAWKASTGDGAGNSGRGEAHRTFYETLGRRLREMLGMLGAA